MRKSLFQIFTAMILFLAACAPAATSMPAAALSTTETSYPLATNTYLPTETPTPSITPLPTIPTITPTFDASMMVTITPAPKAACPAVDTTVSPKEYFPETLDYSSFSSVGGKISEFLNKGGGGELLIERLHKVYPEVEYTGGYGFRDVTGDKIPEFLYIEFYFEGKLIIFSCKDGKFEQIAALSGDHADHAYSVKIEDLNTDGLAEIILIGAFCGSFCHFSIYLYEWNGREFTMIMKTNILAIKEMEIEDVDWNGTKELILSGDNPACLSCKKYIPQRRRTIIYGWNGKDFVEISNEFGKPEYRFQALQDADAMANHARYEEALLLYEQVILSPKLEWWSPVRMEYEQAMADSWMAGITLPPEPLEDRSEYPSLAAYAYYRIMLLHYAERNEQEANLAYKKLQEQFGKDDYARPYVEMAAQFQNAYQETNRMYDSCAAAIQFAVEHPEILIPLGSDYHGSQSHTYLPAVVCPFR